VSPNQQDGVHDGHKKLSDFVEVLARVYEIVEECLKSLEVLVVLIGFLLSDLHFFLELTEGSGVGALILLEELEDLLDAL
jgi:hypothetical protein